MEEEHVPLGNENLCLNLQPPELRAAEPCLCLSLQDLEHTLCRFSLLSLKDTPGSK